MNLTSFAGKNLELRITAINAEDGFYFADPNFDDFALIPEPGSIGWAVPALATTLCVRRKGVRDNHLMR